MSNQFNITLCTLCNRDFDKYNKKDKNKIYGIELDRSKTYTLVIKFVDIEKSSCNKHICTQCISDIINEFERF